MGGRFVDGYLGWWVLDGWFDGLWMRVDGNG